MADYIVQLEPLPEDLIQCGYVTNHILPCPFCGNKSPFTHGQQNTITKIVGYTVTCGNWRCGASVHANAKDGDGARREARNAAVAKWNRRANQSRD